MNENKKNQQQDGEVEINLAELIPYLFHWLWLIAIVGLLTAAIGFAISAFVLTPKYQSTTKVYILNKSNDKDTVTVSDTQLATYLTKDFKELIKSRTVLETVVNECNLKETAEALNGKISVGNTQDTRIISISVKDENPERAQYIANAVREVAAIHLREVMDLEAVNVVEEANLPKQPVEPSKRKFTLIGFLIGAVITIAILIIRYYLDDSIKTSEDIERYLGMTTLATIPMFDGTESDKKKRKKARRK